MLVYNCRHQGNAFLNVSVPLHSLKPSLWHEIWFCECTDCIQMTNLYVRQILFVGGKWASSYSPSSYGYVHKKILLLFLYPPSRPECWEYVLCLFWWWDHSPSAKWMWNPQAHQARREDCHELCKSWTQQLELTAGKVSLNLFKGCYYQRLTVMLWLGGLDILEVNHLHLKIKGTMHGINLGYISQTEPQLGGK